LSKSALSDILGYNLLEQEYRHYIDMKDIELHSARPNSWQSPHKQQTYSGTPCTHPNSQSASYNDRYNPYSNSYPTSGQSWNKQQTSSSGSYSTQSGSGSAGYHSNHAKSTPYRNTYDTLKTPPKPKTPPTPPAGAYHKTQIPSRPPPQASTKPLSKPKWEPFSHLDPIPRLIAFKALAPSYKNAETALQAIAKQDLWPIDIRRWTDDQRKALKKAIRKSKQVHPDKNGMLCR
jgi:hypothetical protein